MSCASIKRSVSFSDHLVAIQEKDRPALVYETRLLSAISHFFQFKAGLFPQIVTLFGNRYVRNAIFPESFGSAILTRKALHQFWDEMGENALKLSADQAITLVRERLSSIWKETGNIDDETETLCDWGSAIEEITSIVLETVWENDEVIKAFHEYFENAKLTHAPLPIKVGAPVRSILKKRAASPEKEESVSPFSLLEYVVASAVKGEEEGSSYLPAVFRNHVERFYKTIRRVVRDEEWLTLRHLVDQPPFSRLTSSDSSSIDGENGPPCPLSAIDPKET
jgi:hypothetical protein